MKVRTDSERVRHSRKLVLELLASSVDLSTTPVAEGYLAAYDARPERFGPPAPPDPERDRKRAGHHVEPDGQTAATVAGPVKVDNELYVRDYSKCILCYKCVDACGEQYQNTFAITVAGRGFDARISTEFVVELPESACVYCGNCIAVCPTGALMFRSEHELREAGEWKPGEQAVTQTICPYCGVGCNLELHVQDNAIVKVTSPDDHDVTRGNLCIKGRFGYQHVQGPAAAGGVGRHGRHRATTTARRLRRHARARGLRRRGARAQRPPGGRGAARDPRRGPRPGGRARGRDDAHARQRLRAGGRASCTRRGCWRRRLELAEIKYCTDVELGEQAYNVVTVHLRRPFEADLVQRNFGVTSACGVCGKASIDSIEVASAPLPEGPLGARRP